jgi:cobalt-zinc-cadmium efflux system membrane fusion protein
LTSIRENLPLSSYSFSRQRVRTLLVVLTATALLLFLVYFGLQWEKEETAAPSADATITEEQTIVLTNAVQRDAGVTVEPVQTRTRSSQLEAPGVLTFDETRTARIGSLVEGKILSVAVQVGDRVSAGAILAEIHSHVIHDAWADYRKAKADRTRRLTELDYLKQAEQRAQRLFAAKAISQQELQRARVERVSAEQAADMTQTEVRRAEEALEHLGITPLGQDPRGEAGEQIPVRSPLAGAILEKNVTSDTAVTPGVPLFVVSDLSTLWALAEIDETKLSRVRVGLPVEIRVAAYPGESFPGTVIFISDTLDPKTRRVTVRCQAPNADGRLKPHMYATISLGQSESLSIVVAPSQALQDLNGKPVVFVAGENGAFTPREVEIGLESEGWTEILSGLQVGEKIVTTGSFLLKSELSRSALQEEE